MAPPDELASTPRSRVGAADARLVGPLLVAAVVLLIELSDAFAIKVPNPPAILVMLVVYSAFSGGFRTGMVSGLIACNRTSPVLLEPRPDR